MIEDDDNECQKPCPPSVQCEFCDNYWDEMKQLGYWRDDIGWTDKGFKEMNK